MQLLHVSLWQLTFFEMVNKWHQRLNGKDTVVVKEMWCHGWWFQQRVLRLLLPSSACFWALLRNPLMTNCYQPHQLIKQEWAIAELSLLCLLHDISAAWSWLSSWILSAVPLWCSFNVYCSYFYVFHHVSVIYSVSVSLCLPGHSCWNVAGVLQWLKHSPHLWRSILQR